MSEMVERVARVFDVDAYLPEGAAGILLPRKIRRADAEALAVHVRRFVDFVRRHLPRGSAP